MTNLIFIDGPPGVGKSTLAETLAAQLPGYKLLLEMDTEHPLHPVPVSEGGADFTQISGMDVNELGDLLLSKWKLFLTAAEDQSFILESYPYQSHLRVLWQMNAPGDLLADWLTEFHKLFSADRPLLVTLNYTGDADRLNQIYTDRGDAWMDFMIEFATNTPYGKAHNLTGYDGTLQLLSDYREVLKTWVDQWPFQRIDFEAWIELPQSQAAHVRGRLL